MMVINDLLRENIRNLKPYSSARNEYRGSEGIFLDANENSIGSVLPEQLNRYPDPQQQQLKERIAHLKELSESSIFLGNGSDEAIDLLIRAFCVPGKDKVMMFPPTYGIYAVSSAINDVDIVNIQLTNDFDLDIEEILYHTKQNIKLIFICSPNNPTGNCMNRGIIREILSKFKALVIIDEAYIDFAEEVSWIMELKHFENLVVLQTFSKAWGLANLRLGIAFAQPAVIQVLNRIKYPYNINGITQKYALKALNNIEHKNVMVKQILVERKFLTQQLSNLKIVKKVYASQANFLLVKFQNAKDVYNYLLNKKFIVRDRSDIILCDNCLRITVGTPEENKLIIDTLREMVIEK